MLKALLIIIASIFVVFLIIAGLMDKSYTMKSTVVINVPQKVAFDYVKNLKNQVYYSKWVMSDPNVKLEYKGIDGTVGFIASWDSKEKGVGVGEQEITKIVEDERYDVDLRFKKPFEATNHAYTTTEFVNENQTKVTTVFEATTPFPMNVMVPMIKKMLKIDMDMNMSNLKKVLESK